MSKSVLVIETPKSCDNCRMIGGVFQYFCRISSKTIYDINIRPKWCPLKPVPEKITAVGEYNDTDLKNDDLPILFKIGWNRCIDKITDGCKND